MYRSAVCFFFFKLDIYVVDFPGVGSFFVPRQDALKSTSDEATPIVTRVF